MSNSLSIVELVPIFSTTSYFSCDRALGFVEVRVETVTLIFVLFLKKKRDPGSKEEVFYRLNLL